MSLMICIPDRDCSKLLAQLQVALPDVKIQLWPQCDDFATVEVVLAWKAPDALWAQLPNLKLVQSFGAGVDSINLALLPESVAVARIVDPQLGLDMSEYVLTQVLLHKLRVPQYIAQQQQKIWKPNRSYDHNRVGILGFGELGQAVSARLLANGFRVSAWSRSAKAAQQVKLYLGPTGLMEMAAQSDYLVCLLPLTDETKGILNTHLFSVMQEHAVIINVARGAHLNEADLLNALDNGQLRGASLDVFNVEPLPPEHPFWYHNKIIMTPHAAALTSLNTAIEQIVDNVRRVKDGQNYLNIIDKNKGY
ncbi:2-hydroxyacid dehydrogenase [Pseudoalteromonas fenneropenaei]|uniref:2-hydroxyacid dehydrogenase n=1 Tax=Pseudoalteromonas fenneropenaei TaxID=1737459 RepID=A0ABV7CMY4_9GAMM